MAHYLVPRFQLAPLLVAHVQWGRVGRGVEGVRPGVAAVAPTSTLCYLPLPLCCWHLKTSGTV